MQFVSWARFNNENILPRAQNTFFLSYSLCHESEATPEGEAQDPIGSLSVAQKPLNLLGKKANSVLYNLWFLFNFHVKHICWADNLLPFAHWQNPSVNFPRSSHNQGSIIPQLVTSHVFTKVLVIKLNYENVYDKMHFKYRVSLFWYRINRRVWWLTNANSYFILSLYCSKSKVSEREERKL